MKKSIVVIIGLLIMFLIVQYSNPVRGSLMLLSGDRRGILFTSVGLLIIAIVLSIIMTCLSSVKKKRYMFIGFLLMMISLCFFSLIKIISMEMNSRN